jgi:hypothetical protein
MELKNEDFNENDMKGENTENTENTEDIKIENQDVNNDNADSKAKHFNEDNGKSKKNRNIKIIVLIILIILLILGLFRCNSNKNYGEKDTPKNTASSGLNISDDPNATKGGLDQTDKNKIIEDLNKKVKEGMFQISMNTNVTYADGSVEGNVNIINNKNNLYGMVVEIYKDSDNTLIYRSGMIAPGYKIEKAKLSTPLTKGTYPCTAYFLAVDQKTKNQIGKAGAKIKVYVLK